MKISDVERITLESYDKAAAFRKQSCSTMNFWQEQFNLLQTLMPSGVIIDVGCGTGGDARMFLPAGYAYVGIDASKKLLNEAKQLVPEADFREINIYALNTVGESGFADNHFDGFWAANSLIHIPKGNINYALQGIKRIVKSSGYGFISMREGDGEHMIEDSQGKRFFSLYTQADFKNLLESNGFDVIYNSRDDRGKNNFSTGFLCYLARNIKS